jgi:hypothetical protein
MFQNIELTAFRQFIYFCCREPEMVKNVALKQCFSTGVPRRTGVPSNSFRCAAKSYNIGYSMH